MFLFLLWLAITGFLGYEITMHGFWIDGLKACAVLAFIFWILGGAAAFSAQRGAASLRRKMEGTK